MQYEVNDLEIELMSGCQLKCNFCMAEKLFGPMSEQTLDNALKFALDMRNKTTSTSFSINFTGGEPGLYNMKMLKEKILDLKTKIDPTKEFKLIFSTNLVYPLTEDHLEVFKLIDGFSVSWDYKDRFNNYKEVCLFFENLRKLKEINNDIGVTCVLTDSIIKEVTPEMLIHFMLSTGIKQFMFNRMQNPYGLTSAEFSAKRTVLNTQVQDYVYRLFRLYEKVKEFSDLQIFELECMVSSFKGKHYNQFSKNCAKRLIHIHANGDLTRCGDPSRYNYGNVNTTGIDEEKYKKVIEKHIKSMHPGCDTCKYIEYCTGGCPFATDDSTGCSVPKKIYDYLLLKENALNNTYDVDCDITRGHIYEVEDKK